jgi:hypothetical protein
MQAGAPGVKTTNPAHVDVACTRYTCEPTLRVRVLVSRCQRSIGRIWPEAMRVAP